MNVAQYIDHTLLKADATPENIVDLTKQAMEHNFYSVCVNPAYVSLAKKQLAGSDVKVCTVVGFPLGASQSEVKAYETIQALMAGADEIDLVINVGYLKHNDAEHNAYVQRDIQSVVAAANGRLVKVILETALLNEDEKRRGCEYAVNAGAHYVKTSTGFAKGGATIEDVKLMREVVGPNIGVKASGGIGTYDEAVAMIQAGASRLGCSRSVGIVTGKPEDGDY